MAKQTIQIADKPTEDEILALLKSSEIGLAVLKGLLGQSASADTVAAIKALLENGSYGLNAIKSAVNGRANETTVAAIKALLENGSYGLYAILSAISGRANETTAAAIKTYLENGTYGLNALRNAIAGNLKTIKSVQRGLANITSTSNAPVSVTISPVVVAKTFVIAQPATFRLDSSGNINGGNANPFAIRLVNSTTIQMVTASSMGQMSWQAVEFY